MTRQSCQRGVAAAASGDWMKAWRSTGRNRPELRRLFWITPAISRPKRCASGVPPAMAGMAIGIGSVRARVMSITAPCAIAAFGISDQDMMPGATIAAPAPNSAARRVRTAGEVRGFIAAQALSG